MKKLLRKTFVCVSTVPADVANGAELREWRAQLQPAPQFNRKFY